MNGHFTNSSMLLHLDKALEALHQGDVKQRKLFLSLMESLQLLRVGYLSLVDPGDLLRMERRPIRWELDHGPWALATATAASVHQNHPMDSPQLLAAACALLHQVNWLRCWSLPSGTSRRSKVAITSKAWEHFTCPVDASYDPNNVVVQAELGLLPIRASGTVTALQPVML